MSLFFTKFVKLDPDPHGSAFILPPGSGSAFRKTAGSGSAKNECGSTALVPPDPDPVGIVLMVEQKRSGPGVLIYFCKIKNLFVFIENTSPFSYILYLFSSLRYFIVVISRGLFKYIFYLFK